MSRASAVAVNPSRSESAGQSGGLDQNHFLLLGLPVSFELDHQQLDQARERIQAVVHPDRFAAAGAAQKRLALQWSTRIHEAYETLREPLKRAAYLLALRGHAVDAETHTRIPSAFLEQQMVWREALEEARGLADPARARAIAQLKAQCESAYASGLSDLSELLSRGNEQDLAAAAAQVRALMFVAKFSEELR